jgi:acyl carrier protein
LHQLVELCKREGILESDLKPGFEKQDLIDAGIIDSMGLLSLQTLIEEHYRLTIPQELFVMELRTLESIAKHLSLKKVE